MSDTFGTHGGTHGVMTSTKSGKFRVIPLADQAAAELARLSSRDRFTGEDDYVFCGADGRRVDGSALRRRFALAQDAAGVKRRRFHDLRHGFGSMAVNVFSSSDVQAFMGHARLQTTERYLTAKPRHDDAARLTEAFKPRTVQVAEPESERVRKR